MSAVELFTFFWEYDGEEFECVYLDDHRDFIYAPLVSHVNLLLPHQFFPQIVQEQYPETSLKLKVKQNYYPWNVFRFDRSLIGGYKYFFPLDDTTSIQCNSLLFSLSIC